MDKPRFVYVTYIRSTPERVWQALTDGAMTSQYWFGHRIEGDWRPGGAIRFYDASGTLVHDDTVLACDPPSLLSYSWRPLQKAFEGEPESKVTFTLEPAGDQVKLSMIHENLEPDGKMFRAISNGWPAVLSSLKTLLETGAALQRPTNLHPPQQD